MMVGLSGEASRRREGNLVAVIDGYRRRKNRRRIDKPLNRQNHLGDADEL